MISFYEAIFVNTSLVFILYHLVSRKFKSLDFIYNYFYKKKKTLEETE